MLNPTQAENKALLDAPPSELSLTDFTPRQHSAKKALVKSQAENHALPDWMEKLVGMMFVGNMATNNRVMSMTMNPPITPMAFSHPGPTFAQPADLQTPAPLAHASTLKRPASPLDYPIVNDWLASLETHIRKKGFGPRET